MTDPEKEKKGRVRFPTLRTECLFSVVRLAGAFCSPAGKMPSGRMGCWCSRVQSQHQEHSLRSEIGADEEFLDLPGTRAVVPRVPNSHQVALQKCLLSD